MNLLNLFKTTLYTTCFDRHWSPSRVLKLFVETVVLAFCASNTFVFFVVLGVSSCCVVCLNHGCSTFRVNRSFGLIYRLHLQGFRVSLAGWTKWRWGRFSPSTSVSPANLHSTNCSTITLIYHLGLYNRPEVAVVPGDVSPTPHKKKPSRKPAWSIFSFTKYGTGVMFGKMKGH
jgi:hypothetical protein